MSGQNQSQNFANHRRFHPLFHLALTLLTAGLFIASLVNLVLGILNEEDIFTHILLVVVAVTVVVIFFIIRAYPLKAQDRVIRAEENLRHFVLSQKLLDPRLSIKQIAALRFASDEEFLGLCKKAAEENMAPVDIKKAIKKWKGDYYRI